MGDRWAAEALLQHRLLARDSTPDCPGVDGVVLPSNMESIRTVLADWLRRLPIAVHNAPPCYGLLDHGIPVLDAHSYAEAEPRRSSSGMARACQRVMEKLPCWFRQPTR